MSSSSSSSRCRSLPTNGGSGKYSYLRNSSYQGLALNDVKGMIEEAVLNKLDVDAIIGDSDTIRIADLGCAVGPNTFSSMQSIMELIEKKLDSQAHEFLVFFNDLPTSDFNTLYRFMPSERRYFVAGIPGSFHGRLFPESSIHFFHCATSLHWLSQAPEELSDESSRENWNKGKIHYTSAPRMVVEAYAAQFARDMTKFLEARAKEIVVGGLMVIIMAGIPDGMSHDQLPAGVMYDLISSILLDMTNEGMVTETQVDSFNLPIYAASPKEIEGLVHSNGCFTIETLELTNPAAWLNDGEINMQEWTDHVRAAMEGVFEAHFGSQVVDEIFGRLVGKLKEHSKRIESTYWKKIQLFVILRRI
ncbi:hypothetical protein MLD38_005435 [Melastoma candidum]|uniref:Uncharacterized protein n=1 Tax=Melastoma candidum TaxID=119954 RepID=A0ACB9RKX5_9MYRT|nr:hypothetical protein MLD38_005435 [Melastoma candidum]